MRGRVEEGGKSGHGSEINGIKAPDSFAYHVLDVGSRTGPRLTRSGQKDLFTVVSEFLNGFFDIAHGEMGLFLFIVWEGRIPSTHQFLDRAHINVTVIHKGFEFGHVLNQEPPVLPDGISAKGAFSFVTMAGEKSECFLLGLTTI